MQTGNRMDKMEKGGSFLEGGAGKEGALLL